MSPQHFHRAVRGRHQNDLAILGSAKCSGGAQPDCCSRLVRVMLRDGVEQDAWARKKRASKRRFSPRGVIHRDQGTSALIANVTPCRRSSSSSGACATRAACIAEMAAASKARVANRMPASSKHSRTPATKSPRARSASDSPSRASRVSRGALSCPTRSVCPCRTRRAFRPGRHARRP